MPFYDILGRTYGGHRHADPRIARIINAALGDAATVVNVGAGAGSYEPPDRSVVAVEPSSVMIAQRPASAAPAVQGSAELLPFPDNAFDAALAILTVHHWSDRRAGLAEMRRVARDRVVVLTWDPEHPGFWLVRDYFPDLIEFDRRIFPKLAELEAALGRIDVSVVPIPHDCVDGFLGAYWRRPAAYLDEGVRAGISTFARIGDIPARIERLRADLESGQWAVRNAELLRLEELDVGYRLVVGRRAA
ncbi:MAG TPA: methyltransferase domain-containing protein [Polyangiaceae bacterium]|nr:methyltransferase domain-containing protein [Polyangiaceae bacterium]